MSELVREALRLYQEKDDLRRQQLAKLHQVLEQTRADAERRGSAKITNREIEAEIAAHRYERRHKKIRQPA